MIVADLKQHLADLAKLLDATGGKTVAKDLASIADGLTPFASQSLPEFSKFLALAHEYQTTGKLSAPATAPRAASKSAANAPNVEEIAQRLRSLYDRAGNLSITMLQIETDLGQLKGLKKDGLVRICDVLELMGMAKKTIPIITGAIRQKILDRRSAAQRAEMIQNPT